jgi:hypothetical protein
MRVQGLQSLAKAHGSSDLHKETLVAWGGRSTEQARNKGGAGLVAKGPSGTERCASTAYGS